MTYSQEIEGLLRIEAFKLDPDFIARSLSTDPPLALSKIRIKVRITWRYYPNRISRHRPFKPAW